MFTPDSIPMSLSFRPILLGLLVACAPLFAAKKDPNLIAQWTFQKDLQADWGGFELSEIDWGSDAQMTQRDGLVHLGGGRLLINHELNSEAFKNLRDGVTIWARMRLDAVPAQACFLMGFRTESDPGVWKDMSLALFYDTRNNGGVGFYSNLANGDLFAGGPTSLAPVKPGEFFTVALIFDGLSGGREIMLNGKVVNREIKLPAKTLAEFSNFALGRLMKHSTVAMTYDEVRIYGSVLSQSEIIRIESEFKDKE